MREREESEKDWLPLITVIILVIGIAGGGLWWLVLGAENSEEETSVIEGAVVVESAVGEGASQAIEVVEDSPEVLENLGVKVTAIRPEMVAEQIAKILESGDLGSASEVFGGANGGLSPKALAQLQAMAGEQGLQLQQVREVGELEINRRKRFALEWDGDVSPLFLDVVRGANGTWSVETARLPQAGGELELSALGEGSLAEGEPRSVSNITDYSDSLSVSDSFLQAALKQDFTVAKSFVDTGGVSDAKIAAMCILFEEGQYRLNPAKPLRAMFNREKTAGFLANVLTNEADSPAQFGVNLKREAGDDEWKVSEINLDSLLADYARRVAGGDVYYTPLVPNPKGGDTLVIFFGFDEEELAPRTERQLQIVADILRTDPNRKLTISGHADSLGSDNYNRKLSEKRAAAVRNYLSAKGVNREQIVSVGAGESQPRRPNETEKGEDNPEGRRANRRTEIYLDF